MAELVGLDLGGVLPWTDGESLVGPARGEGERSRCRWNMRREGSYAPLVALRDGPWKLILCELDPPILTHLDEEPAGAGQPGGGPGLRRGDGAMTAAMRARWDLARFDAEVRASQARRHVVYEALRNGAYYPWDFSRCKRRPSAICATIWT